MVESQDKDRQWIGIIGSFAVVWSLIGVATLVLNFSSSPQDLIETGSTQAQVNYIFSTPSWAKLANFIAVFVTAIGSVCLLMRSNWAYYSFALALFSLMLVMLDALLRSGFKILGAANNGMSMIVFIIMIFLFWATHTARQNNALK